MKTRLGLAVAIGLSWTASAPAQVFEQTISLGGLQVTVWSVTATANVRKPVVLFSHGFHGCSTQSSFLMEALALEGFLVFAPNHADATCNGGPRNGAIRLRSRLSIRRPGATPPFPTAATPSI